MGQILVSLQKRDPPIGIVTLVGEHDFLSSTRLANELAVLLDDGFGIVVDLREATFVDADTLSALLAARHDAEDASLGFTLVLSDRGSTQVDGLLDLTGLRGSFASFPTVELATAAARAHESGAARVRSA